MTNPTPIQRTPSPTKRSTTAAGRNVTASTLSKPDHPLDDETDSEDSLHLGAKGETFEDDASTGLQMWEQESSETNQVGVASGGDDGSNNGSRVTIRKWWRFVLLTFISVFSIYHMTLTREGSICHYFPNMICCSGSSVVMSHISHNNTSTSFTLNCICYIKR